MTNPSPDIIEIDVDVAVTSCRDALILAGTSQAIAERVARALVANETADVPSHGLLRLADYVAHIRTGLLDPTARPDVAYVSEQARRVDGRRGFGVLAADTVAENIEDMLNTNQLCAVALVNAGHIGRLADIGEAVTRANKAVLGFVNYLGGGQRVAPWRGRDGRLCTNPLLIAVPGRPRPFILDMSTSAVSEGTIRRHWQAGKVIPTGWLIDADGHPVHDPARLYTDPPTAFMAPLGGDHGYKGFGLAVAVELLAGVLAGAGFAAPGSRRHGNGGLFLGLDPTLAGRDLDTVLGSVEELRAHLLASSPWVRLPGQQDNSSGGGQNIQVRRRLWDEVLAFANGKA